MAAGTFENERFSQGIGVGVNQPATLPNMTNELTFEDVQHASHGAAEDAVTELLEHGIPLFYVENQTDVLEQANGQRFEIEYTQLARGAYRIVRELPRMA